MDPIAMWRATYTPGRWVVLAGPTSLVVMRPAPPSASQLFHDLWADVVSAASIDDLVRTLAAFRVDAMPAFAAFFWSEDGMSSLVRGLAVTDPRTGDVVADGTGVRTWREVGLGGLTLVRIDMEPVEQEAVLQLPLAVGCVLASAVQLDVSEEARISLPSVPRAGRPDPIVPVTASAPASAEPEPPAAPSESTADEVRTEPDPSDAPVIADTEDPVPTRDDEPEVGIAATVVPEADAVTEPAPEPAAEPALPPVVVGADVPAAVADAEALVASMWGVEDADEVEPVSMDIAEAADDEPAPWSTDTFDLPAEPVQADRPAAPADAAPSGFVFGRIGGESPAPSPTGPALGFPSSGASAPPPAPPSSLPGFPGFPGFPGSPTQSVPAVPPPPPGMPDVPSAMGPTPQVGPPPGQYGPPPGQFGPPPGQFGPPPGQFGPPPGQFGPPPGQFGPPPGQFGPPPGQFGPPPGQFGPPPGQFGPPPGQFGPPPGQFGPPPGQFGPPPGQYGPPPTQPVPPPPPPATDEDGDGGTIFSTSLAASHKPNPAVARSGGAALILAGTCAQGHANPPGLASCRRCGRPVDTANPRLVARPVMAVLVTAGGATADLVDTVLIGRSPSPQQGDTTPILLPVPSPNSDISRTHVRVSAKDWDVLVTDLHSTNGTIVIRPGEQPARMTPGSPTPVPIGTVIDLGDGATVTLTDPA